MAVTVASRCTKLASKESVPICKMHETQVCDKHCGDLHRMLSPASYTCQWKCTVCPVGICGSNYHSSQVLYNLNLIYLRNILGKTLFEVEKKSIDKVCIGCYHFGFSVTKKRKLLGTKNFLIHSRFFWDSTQCHFLTV